MNDSSLKIWLLAARPKTLWAGIAPVVIGTVMAQAEGLASWPFAGLALIGSLLIQVGTNFANDYFDFVKGADTADRIGPLRATQAGLVPPETMKLVTFLVLFLSAVVGAFMIYRAGWPMAVICGVSILLAILYTGGPYPLGYIGLGDVFVLVCFGPMAVGGTYYLQALDINSTVLLAGCAPGLLSVAVLTVNNLRDMDGDRRAGKKTLVVRFGRKFARAEYVIAVTAASSIPCILYYRSGTHPYSMLTLLVLPLALPAFRTILTRTDGPALNRKLAYTAKLLLAYSILFSIGWLIP